MASQLTPLHFAVELTNRCNFHCQHCLRTNNIAPNLDLPVPLYKKFLQQAQSYHSPQLIFTGGEPTLHQDFETILVLTESQNFSYGIVTNGWNFEENYPLLLRYRKNLQAVIFSLDGAKEETHDAIRQQPGSYRKIIQACMICYYKQLPFRLSVTLHRMNVTEVDEVLSLASKLGAEAVNVGFAQLTPELVAKGLAFSPQERKTTQEYLFKLQEQSPVNVNLMFDFFAQNPYFLCQTLLMGSIALDYNGCVRFCCQLSNSYTDGQFNNTDCIGDLHDVSLWECHRRLVRKIAAFQEEKITRLEQGLLTDNDHFPCYYCMKYFGKLGWLRHFPDSEWNEDDK